MSLKGQATALEERIAIAKRADACQSVKEIAEVLGRPRATIGKGGKDIGRELEQAYAAKWVDQLPGHWQPCHPR